MDKYRIGIIGTGFIARGLVLSLKQHPQLEISGVVTRRPIDTLQDFPLDIHLLTNDITTLLPKSDLIVECSGDVLHGTEMIEKAFAVGLPVVTMNSELQIVSGSALSQMGTLVEAEGDQPGSLCALDREVREMGFEPIVYGNIKRFLNLNPTPEDMKYWSKRQGISEHQVTAFTDGTKVQVEQALVANALGATIACRNLSGIPCKDLEDGAQRLGEMGDSIGTPISDYVLSSTAPAGVFIVAKHQIEQKSYLEYLKLGVGPYYVLVRPYHLCHLEIPRTILRLLSGEEKKPFNNGEKPSIQVVAVAKRPISKDETLRRGLGSFLVRGEAVKIKNCPDGVPIGLLEHARFLRPVAEGQIVTFADVVLPESRALTFWQATCAQVIASR